MYVPRNLHIQAPKTLELSDKGSEFVNRILQYFDADGRTLIDENIRHRVGDDYRRLARILREQFVYEGRYKDWENDYISIVEVYLRVVELHPFLKDEEPYRYVIPDTAAAPEKGRPERSQSSPCARKDKEHDTSLKAQPMKPDVIGGSPRGGASGPPSEETGKPESQIEAKAGPDYSQQEKHNVTVLEPRSPSKAKQQNSCIILRRRLYFPETFPPFRALREETEDTSLQN